MHNDAVVQGLSEVPLMRKVPDRAILTIGTGLGNAHFSSKGGCEKGGAEVAQLRRACD